MTASRVERDIAPLELRWARSALAAVRSKPKPSLQKLANLVALINDEMKRLGNLDPTEAESHPATAVLVAEMAERCGLHFFYPSHHKETIAATSLSGNRPAHH